MKALGNVLKEAFGGFVADFLQFVYDQKCVIIPILLKLLGKKRSIRNSSYYISPFSTYLSCLRVHYLFSICNQQILGKSALFGTNNYSIASTASVFNRSEVVKFYSANSRRCYHGSNVF